MTTPKNENTITPQKNIAILYIVLGRYGIFWKDFYKSAEKYLFPNHKKTYFLWTNNKKLPFENNENVVKLYQKKLGWPFDTMMRFKIFLEQEEQLKNFDYIYFFNANLIFKQPVSDEILPSIEAHQGLAVTQHPGFYDQPPEVYTYETNQKSTAYVPQDKGIRYVAGGINGGTAEAYLKMCHTLKDNIETDLKNNIIAVWHDESHLNHYILDKNPLVIPPNYLYPEGWDLPEYKNDIKILLTDKENPSLGGVDWLRGKTNKKKGILDILIFDRKSKLNMLKQKLNKDDKNGTKNA